MDTNNPIEPQAVENNFERVRSEIDYIRKIQPLLCAFKRGKGNDELAYPPCVTVDKMTGYIYIADCLNDCVNVFDSNCEGKMCCPRRLVICRSKVVISHANCILNYSLDGEYISRIGKQGQGELEFKYPLGIEINESNDDIYICDSNNNRVQILSQDFKYKSQFGSFEYPRDVKLSKDYIYVLDASNPCIHLFNHNHILQKSVISLG
ncbi:Cell surface protein [Oopsacas minuta]|uniref:Cell surface protein n=1 Tax=Oopsacas minuta TaxID=111878 RepID=A0AAV7K9R0_9METZ|nr:Cell surface protein [Oopsacas minuta]